MFIFSFVTKVFTVWIIVEIYHPQSVGFQMNFIQECEDYFDAYGGDPFLHLIVGEQCKHNNQ